MLKKILRGKGKWHRSKNQIYLKKGESIKEGINKGEIKMRDNHRNKMKGKEGRRKKATFCLMEKEHLQEVLWMERGSQVRKSNFVRNKPQNG